MLRQKRVKVSLSSKSVGEFGQFALAFGLVVLCLYCGRFEAAAQGVKRENASFGSLDNGTAQFTRILSASGDSLLNGAYSFSSVLAGNDSAKVFYEISGAYALGKAEGKWEFVRIELTPSGKPFAQDFAIVQPAVGIETNLEATFIKGAPTGRWRVQQRIADETNPAAGTNLSALINLSQATASGAFEYRNAGCEVVGSFDQEGKLHGTWTIAFDQTPLEAVETREYRNGVLVRHSVKLPDSMYELANDSALLESLNDKELRTFDFGKLPTAILMKRVRHVEEAANLVKMSDTAIADALEVFDIGFTSLVFQQGEGMAKVNPVQVRFRQIPILKDEKILNQQIANTAQQIVNASEVFLTSPTVEMARLSNEQVARQCAELEVLLEVSHDVFQLCAELDDEELSFVDRNAWFQMNYVKPIWPVAFTFEFGETTESIAFLKYTAFGDGANRAELLDALNRMLAEVQGTIDEVMNQLRVAELDTYLSQREEALMFRRDSLNNLFSGEPSPLTNQYHNGVAQGVRKSLDLAFEQYAKTDIALRGGEIDNLEQCLLFTEGLHDALSKLPLRIDRIDREYTRSIWNPYTYTFMEEVQKERIYKAYNQFILPHFITEINAFDSCRAYEKVPELLIDLHDRLVLLLNEETSQVERDLRRVNSPVEAAAILQITLPNQ
jgi:hypothetical protein